ncbi:MAG: 50S ribosomal protein L21 [Coriobacteriia bacterium]
MYAVVKIGGKQARVEQGSLLAVEKIDAEIGSVVTLPVVTIADGERLLVRPADLIGATVSAEIVEHFLGDKQIIFKFKKRKGYKRTKGHRQMLTNVRIIEIAADGTPAKSAKAAKAASAPKEEKAAPAEAPAEAKAPKAAKAAAAVETLAAEKQCVAIKSDGTRCANKAKESSDYCGVHAKKHEG